MIAAAIISVLPNHVFNLHIIFVFFSVKFKIWAFYVKQEIDAVL
jgi:hypothetical protein